MKDLINKNLLIAVLLILSFISDNSHSFSQTNLDPYMKAQIEKLKADNLKSGPSFELVGTLEKGKHTSYSVNGEDFSLNPDAQIIGELQLGKSVQVDGKILSGIKYASSLVTSEPSHVDSAHVDIHGKR